MSKSKSKMNRKTISLCFAALIVLSGLIVFLVNRVQGHARANKNVVTASQDTKGETSPPSSKVSTTSSVDKTAAQPGDTKSNLGGAAVTSLGVPSGDFVSSHQITIDSEVTSVCNTSPGATCEIVFTLDGQTKILSGQVTDRGGTTYWNNWTPKKIGLTSGSWQVKAVASSDGKIEETNDALALKVTE